MVLLLLMVEGFSNLCSVLFLRRRWRQLVAPENRESVGLMVPPIFTRRRRRLLIPGLGLVPAIRIGCGFEFREGTFGGSLTGCWDALRSFAALRMTGGEKYRS